MRTRTLTLADQEELLTGESAELVVVGNEGIVGIALFMGPTD